MEQRVVTIIGGTGFVGRYVVKLLAQSGYTVRVIARRPNNALHLKTAGSVGQVVLMSGNIADPASLADKLAHSFAVINLAGILFEGGKQRFASVHAHGAEKLAQLAKSAGAQRFIQISALGVDKARGSDYARSKLLGEKAVLTAFPEASILRPSVVFGPEDNFYNQFARMAAMAPALPLIGGGGTRFQPVYAGDVAKAVLACLTQGDTMGQTYELGGPNTYSFRDILRYIMDITGRQRPLVPLPLGVASAIGLVGEWMPRPPLTRDQVELLKTDNVVSAGAKTFVHLGLTPTAVEMVVPDYLQRFHAHSAKAAA
ncbi:MAG: complex I NDUFA9 subunit family protein [Proteobacteria bacterium]|nr:complex I NDUFA9 subunit family protein [Pseudomonadota bacterium]